MASGITSRYIHGRHTAADGKTTLMEHLIWDAPGDSGSTKFIAARQREADAANARHLEEQGKVGLAKAEQITEKQFREARK